MAPSLNKDVGHASANCVQVNDFWLFILSSLKYVVLDSKKCKQPAQNRELA